MRPRAGHRWQLALPLALPSLGGLAYLAAFDAPARLIAVNAGALLLGVAWVLRGRLPSRWQARRGLAAAAALVLFAPLLTGPAPGGAARWLMLGPVALHSGALLLPLIIVLVADERWWGAAILALTTAALALQPDPAALAALALAAAVLARNERSIAMAAISAAAAALAATTLDAAWLEPQRYSEGVLADVAARSLAGAAGLGVLLLAAPGWLCLADDEALHPQRAALAAALGGFAVMACLAPFPFPLIGYGAAPILGFALGLAGTAPRTRIAPLLRGRAIG